MIDRFRSSNAFDEFLLERTFEGEIHNGAFHHRYPHTNSVISINVKE